MPNLSATQQIEKLKAEYETAIIKLKNDALAELETKRAAAAETLKGIEAEIAELSGKPARKARKAGGGAKPAGTGKKPSLQELKALLAAAPGKSVGIRKEGLDLANVKTLAAANPGLLKISGKSPWFNVTLLK